MTDLDAIIASEQPDIDKVAQAFAHLTDRIMREWQKELEIKTALSDREGQVKEQIKLECFRTARTLFNTCFKRVTGRRAWDE